MSVISFLCLDCIGEFSFYLSGFWGDTDKFRLSVFNLNPLPVFTRTRYFIMAQIIPLLGGVRGGSIGRGISVNISLIPDFPPPYPLPRGDFLTRKSVFKVKIMKKALDLK